MHIKISFIIALGIFEGSAQIAFWCCGWHLYNGITLFKCTMTLKCREAMQRPMYRYFKWKRSI